MAQYLVLDTFWTDKLRIDEAESTYQEILANRAGGQCTAPASSLVSEIAKARQQIKQTLDGGDAPAGGAIEARITALEEENKVLKKSAAELQSIVKSLENRIAALEGGKGPAKAAAEAPVSKKEEKNEDDDDEDDDDFDLFGSDEEDEEAAAERERINAERVAAYNEKKSKKAAVIAKSSVLLDVKPWDDETDMAAMEKEVRSIQMDGLVWGAAKLVPVGYGIKKLQIMCVVEDEKISIDDLSDQICEFEDYVQSVDVAAFNKI